MSKGGAPRHDPVPIGEVVAPPFVRLPDPAILFSARAERFRAVAHGHQLAPYLIFLADLSDVQQDIVAGLPHVEMPDAATLERSRLGAMPPLDRTRLPSMAAFEVTLGRLLEAARGLAMPTAGQGALDFVAKQNTEQRLEMSVAVLSDAIPMETLAEHVFVAAALQVHFSRMAEQLDPKSLAPVGDGACPCCGAPPVTSVIVGWLGSHGARFCACSLCATLWNYVRIKCTVCGSTKGIGYTEVDGGAGTVKAETCEECRSYVKVLYQHQNPALDPVADDVGALGLDMLVRDEGYRRGGVNPFLIGY